jgi:hypothetical protein
MTRVMGICRLCIVRSRSDSRRRRLHPRTRYVPATPMRPCSMAGASRRAPERARHLHKQRTPEGDPRRDKWHTDQRSPSRCEAWAQRGLLGQAAAHLASTACRASRAVDRLAARGHPLDAQSPAVEVVRMHGRDSPELPEPLVPHRRPWPTGPQRSVGLAERPTPPLGALTGHVPHTSARDRPGADHSVHTPAPGAHGGRGGQHALTASVRGCSGGPVLAARRYGVRLRGGPAH